MTQTQTTWQNRLFCDENIRSFCDWLTIGAVALFLNAIAAGKKLVDQHEVCVPGFTTDAQTGEFECGATKNASWTYPHIEWSITSFDSLIIGWAPFLVLFVFNAIYFNVPYFRNKIPIDTIPSNLQINTSLLRWCDAILRCMLLVSATTTLLGQILKMVTGLPRPNAYTLLENNYRVGSVYVSFPSGHIAIGYTNCFVFGLFCQNAIKYSLKQHLINKHTRKSTCVQIKLDPRLMKCCDNIETSSDKPNNKTEISDNNDDNKHGSMINESHAQHESFNGHYWFFLPIWNWLNYFPTLCLLIAWSPLIFPATYIGVTRIREYWHSDTDCVAGALLGVACGYYFGYCRYYHEIYGIRIYVQEQLRENQVNDNRCSKDKINDSQSDVKMDKLKESIEKQDNDDIGCMEASVDITEIKPTTLADVSADQ